MKPKKTNKQTSDLLKLTSGDAAPESPASSKARIAHASSKVKYEEKLIFENDDFRLLFSQAKHFLTKNTINTPAKNNKRFLITDVFHL